MVRSLTCAPAEVPRADLLLTESTFGRPDISFPPVEGLRRRIVDVAREVLAAGGVPVFLGYAFGKGPEVVKILLDAGVPVSVHESIARLLRVYRRAGYAFGKPRDFSTRRRPPPGHALVAPPSARWHPALVRLDRSRFVAITGRAILDPSRLPFRADEAVPLSDHADFDGLLRVAELTGAGTVLTTHGFAEELAAALRESGTDARPLAGAGPHP